MSEADIDRYAHAKEELRGQLGDRADHLAAEGAAMGYFDLIELACASLAAAYPTDNRPRCTSSSAAGIVFVAARATMARLRYRSVICSGWPNSASARTRS